MDAARSNQRKSTEGQLPIAADGASALAAKAPSAAEGYASVPGEVRVIAGACPSITQPQTRQEGEDSPLACIQGVLNIDWWESAGCIQWSPAAKEFLDEIERCQYQAGECREPVPCSAGDGQVFVHDRGIGSGRGSRLEFRLEWLGATIGLSSRNDATRLLSNFSLRIPGTACLIHGCDMVRNQVLTWLSEWGGSLQDEWVRRLDLCVDLPEFDFHQRIFPACEAGQYVSTMRRNSSHRDCDRITGFAIGSSTGARLTIYDKLAEVKHKNDSAYGMAMIQRRWDGLLPDSAGRVEYQLHREFFQQFEGLRTAVDVLARLPDVVERLVQFEKRPFFQLTDRVPDRKGRHQDRVGVLPEWEAIISLIRKQAGQPRRPLTRLARGLIKAKLACMNAIGHLTSAGAELEFTVESKADLVALLEELLRRNDVSDDMIRLKWQDKARRYGTLVKVTEFAFGVNQAS